MSIRIRVPSADICDIADELGVTMEWVHERRRALVREQIDRYLESGELAVIDGDLVLAGIVRDEDEPVEVDLDAITARRRGN